jgi:hypothetical protein
LTVNPIVTTVETTTMGHDDSPPRRTVDLAAVECVERRLEAAHLMPDHATLSIEHAGGEVHVVIEYDRMHHHFRAETRAASVRAAANECVANLLTQIHQFEHGAHRGDTAR